MTKIRRYFKKIVSRINAGLTGIEYSVPNSPQSDEFYYNLAQEMRKNAIRGRRPGTREILEATPVKPGYHILDVGFGAGRPRNIFLTKACR